MNIGEYIEKAKSELDDMLVMFEEGNRKDPDMWPLDMDAEEWTDQELATRFAG